MYVAAFLLRKIHDKFAFTLISVEIRENWCWILAGVVVRFWFFQFLMVATHSGSSQRIALLRVGQACLVHPAEMMRLSQQMFLQRQHNEYLRVSQEIAILH